LPKPTPLDELKATIAGGKALLVCGAGVSRAVTETDSAEREALREEARAAWTGIGALGLVRDYLDFRMELKP
jgi:hypothetical protein